MNNEIEKSKSIIPLKNGFQATRIGLVISGEPSFESWKNVGTTLQAVEQATQWLWGDWLNFGEQKYGEMYTEALEESGYDYQTLRHAKVVAAKIEMCRRRHNLSFSHHQEVAALEPEIQDELLRESEDNAWTRKKLREKVRSLQPPASALPEGIFQLIYADPPWQYRNTGLRGSAEEHYPTMDTDAICALSEKLKPHIYEKCVLFLWATNPCLPDALKVVEAWGFEYKTNLVWVKDQAIQSNLGFYTLGKHELLFIATKGSIVPDQSNRPISVFEEARREHSRKPEKAYNIIESMYPDLPGPFWELFYRGEIQHHKGERWIGWGNDIKRDILTESIKEL